MGKQNTHVLLVVVESPVEVWDAAGEVDVTVGLLMLVPVLEEEGRGSVPVRVTPYENKPKGLFDTCI